MRLFKNKQIIYAENLQRGIYSNRYVQYREEVTSTWQEILLKMQGRKKRIYEVGFVDGKFSGEIKYRNIDASYHEPYVQLEEDTQFQIIKEKAIADYNFSKQYRSMKTYKNSKAYKNKRINLRRNRHAI